MTTISSIGSAWSSASMQRASRPGPSPERLLSKIDTDGSGGVSDTELQGLLDDVSKKTGVSSQTSAADLVKQYDANADGSLSGDELGKTLQSVLPAPPSTMAFAQSRSSENSGSASSATGQAGDDLFGKVDGDGDGTVSQAELQSLLEAMSRGSDSEGLFSALDSDGDGSLTQAEFDAGRPSGQAAQAGGMQAMGGMPPPPGGPGRPGGAGATEAASGSSAATIYDPLDTNEDGVVSAAERLAGATSAVEEDAVAALFNAIDTDGDSSISASESEAFIAQLTSQAQSGSAAGTETSGQSDLARLADFALQQYERTASDWRTASSSSLSAMA